MTINEFQMILVNNLKSRGLDAQQSTEKVVMLINTFSNEDLREIESYSVPADVEDIADELYEIMTGMDPVSAETIKFDASAKPESNSELEKTIVSNSVNSLESTTEMFLEEDILVEKVKMNSRSLPIFIGISIVSSPAWILALLFILSLFGIVLMAVYLIIALLVLLSISILCVGVIGLLIGIIYGVSQIMSGQIGPGIFEMGIGFIILSLSIAISVLSYNFAIRYVPFVIRQVISFWSYVWGKIGHIINGVKEWCNTL